MNLLTFFAWAGTFATARIRPPQVTRTAYAIPADSIDFWLKYLTENNVDRASAERFGERVIQFRDPDGLELELVGTPIPRGTPWITPAIPPQHAIRGFYSATLTEEGYENTARLLTDIMGFKAVSSDQNRFRYRASAGGGFASIIDLLCVPGGMHGSVGAGAVHHIAFRTPDDAQQAAWRSELVSARFNVSPVMNREYFHSIYYREPGGILFEIATDNPGFTIDQPAAELGTKLMLPPWFEKARPQIVQALPPVRLPAAAQ